MADYGLLGGLAEGLRAGFQSYKDTKKEAVDQAIKEKMMKMEELKTAGDLSEKLGYLPKGYFSPETIKALGATDGSAPPSGSDEKPSDVSGLLEGSQAPADKVGLVKPGMVDPNAAPQNPSVPEGSYAIPGTLTKKQRADRDELNKFNVQLNPQGKAAKFDAKGNVEIYELPKTEKQALSEKKGQLDFDKEQQTFKTGLSSDLRKEWQNHPTTKATDQLSTAYSKIKKSAEQKSAAGDMGLLYAFMKMQDPGSTVRESEFSAGQNSGSLDQKLQGVYKRLATGERLTPEQRNDFIKNSSNMYNAQIEQQERLNSQYTGLSKRQGANPKDVVIPSYEQVLSPNGAESAPADPQIAEFAKQNGLEYKHAASILKLRGYGK